jgi:hypothetical protein
MWRSFTLEFDVEDAAGLAILQSALEAWDRAQAAREAIDRDGMTVLGADGQLSAYL